MTENIPQDQVNNCRFDRIENRKKGKLKIPIARQIAERSVSIFSLRGN